VATKEMVLQPFQGWSPALQAASGRFTTPLDNPCRTGLVVIRPLNSELDSASLLLSRNFIFSPDGNGIFGKASYGGIGIFDKV
jgi:hypothetical protein